MANLKTTKINDSPVLSTVVTSAGNTVQLPTANGQFREIILGQVGENKLVFYQEWYENSKQTTATFTGGAFKEILLIWTVDASITDTQTQRTTLTAFTNSTWTTVNAYRHRVYVIGVK